MKDIPRNVSTFISTAQSLLNILPDGVIVILPDGEIIYANNSAARFLDMRPEELVGANTADFNQPDWREISKVFATGESQIGVRFTIGDKLFLSSRLPLIFNGGIEAVVSFFQGVFSYDKVTMELEWYKQMAALLDAIMESSYDGLWITDRHGIIVKLNKAAERITGCEAGDVLGRNVADLVRDGFVNESVTLEVLKRKTTVTLVQNTKLNKKVLATGSPIFNSKGEIDVIIINDRDITELNRMRSELEESKALVDLYRHELSDLQFRELESDYYACRSRVMETIYQKALRVAKFDSTVLLSGASGVGKGILAKLIHKNSENPDGPFIRVDCAAIVDTLFESELFGYEKGAFTGAGPKGKAGLIEMAAGGTLFLDEISEVPLNQQVKLLRFLDEKKLIRVGGTSSRKVVTRVIAATNKDLAAEVRDRKFRKDLFYRLNVVSLLIPPLRERPQDILDLISFFLNKMSQRHNLRKKIQRDALDALLSYGYPGNVRELENIVESMMIMSQSDSITLDDLPAEVKGPWISPKIEEDRGSESLGTFMERVEVEHILRALQKYGSQREAARRLGINQSTISRKLKKMGHSA